MAEHDAPGARGGALGGEYFRRKRRELEAQAAARDEQVRREMGARVGVDDPEMLRELRGVGFTPDTIALLPLVPVVQVAWADGAVADAERRAILELARARGIADASAADHQLTAWLADRPAPEVFSGATRLIRALLDRPSGDDTPIAADELVAHCESIAAASGGLFGLKAISDEERAMLTAIARELHQGGR